MKKVEVFETGCKKCVTTEGMIKKKAEAIGAEIELDHVYDLVAIASRSIITTPAIMVDGKLVNKGGLPNDAEIEEWTK